MKNTIFLILIILLAASCKKKENGQCSFCSCISSYNDTASVPTSMDSATFYQAILGTWYLQQFDTIPGTGNCISNCYCDTSHPFVFLPNDSLIMTLPDNQKLSFAYTFYNLAPHTVNPQSGVFIISANNATEGQITYYNNNYVTITILHSLGLYPPPNYFLTRH